MNFSTFITVILLAGGFFFIFAQMTNEAQDLYPEANINDSQIEGQYDYVNDVNDTISPLQETFKKIEDPEVGWFSKLVSGIAAVPYAIIKIPGLVFSTFGYGGSLVFGILTTFSFPTYLLILVGVMIVVWGITKLISVYHRWVF